MIKNKNWKKIRKKNLANFHMRTHENEYAKNIHILFAEYLTNLKLTFPLQKYHDSLKFFYVRSNV